MYACHSPSELACQLNDLVASQSHRFDISLLGMFCHLQQTKPQFLPFIACQCDFVHQSALESSRHQVAVSYQQFNIGKSAYVGSCEEYLR